MFDANINIGSSGREIYTDFFKLMKPRPFLTVAGWADMYRYLSSEASSEPGKWKTERTPYLRDIMNAVNDPKIHTVVIMTCSQIGKSEAINNIMFYYAHQDPCPILMIQPTLTDAEDYSKIRLSTSIRDSKELKDVFGDDASKSRKSSNTILQKKFEGGRIVLIGANSPSGLSSKPIRVVLADEIDRYETTKEGDPIDLARKRTATFYNRKLVLTSTPRLKGISTIEKWYNISDQRKYFVPCDGCGEHILLKWSERTVVWEKDADGNHLPETAMYCCPECGLLLNDVQLNSMVKQGEWRAIAPFNGIAGFGDFPELYSPWTKLSETVKDFLEAKKDTESLRVWVNTALGQPWEEENEKLEHADIFERRETYDLLIPMEAAVITAAVDVQDDRLEILTQAWGRDERNWSLEHIIFNGNPGIEFQESPNQGNLFQIETVETAPGVWNQLDIFLQKTYDHESGVRLPISSVAIDIGGHCTDQVYSFVRPRQGRGIHAIKGASQRGKPIIDKPSKKNKGKVNLYISGVFAAKEVIMSRLRLVNSNRAGYMHFPDRFSLEFFEQLTSEKKVTRVKRGQKYEEWVKTRTRNEAFDLCVYNLIALRIAYPDRNVLNKVVEYMYAKAREIKDNIPAPNNGKVRRIISKGVQV